MKIEILFFSIIIFLGIIGTHQSYGDFTLDLTTNKPAYEDTETIEILIKNESDSDAILNLWVQKISYLQNKAILAKIKTYTITGDEIDITHCVDNPTNSAIPPYSTITLT